MCNLYITKIKVPISIGTLLYFILLIVYLVAIAIAPKSNMPPITSPGVVQLNILFTSFSNNKEKRLRKS